MFIRNYLITLLIFFSPVFAYSYMERNLDNYVSEFLTVTKWNEQYKEGRDNEIEYLIGNVDGVLLQDLSVEQKIQLSSWLRKMLLDQLIKDQKYFKKYLVNEYSKFFIIDELDKLIRYFKTDVMQFIIEAQIKNRQLTIDEIEVKLSEVNDSDREIIEWFRNSYLHARYLRFQKDITPKMNKMLADRMKEVFDVVMDKIPELIGYIKANQSTSLDLNIAPLVNNN